MPRRKLSDDSKNQRLDEVVAGKLDPVDGAYSSEQRESDARALRMRLSGATYREVARALDFAGPSGAHQAVQRELGRRLVEPANDLREIELLRLERIQAALWIHIITPNVDIATLEKAVARLLQVSRRRSDLLGLDAPKKLDITHQIRAMAIAEGLDPDQAVLDAQAIISRQ